MPRARKPPDVAPGQTYGDRQAMEQMVDAGPPLPTGDDLHNHAVQGASQMAPPPPGGILGGPSIRPNEPVTAGADRGPGPGPEVLNPLPVKERQTVRLLQQAAAATNNPKLAEMARRAQQPVGRRPVKRGPF